MPWGSLGQIDHRTEPSMRPWRGRRIGESPQLCTIATGSRNYGKARSRDVHGVDSDELMPDGMGDQRRTRGEPELVQDIADVAFHRARADRQGIAAHAVRLPRNQ